MEVGEFARTIRGKLVRFLPERPERIPPDEIDAQNAAVTIFRALENPLLDREDPGRILKINFTITTIMGNMDIGRKDLVATRGALSHAFDILVAANALCKKPVVNDERDKFCYRVTNEARLRLIAEGKKDE